MRYSVSDRFLRIFGDVRPREGARLLVMAANLTLLLFAYYLLKTLREPLILGIQGGGAEVKSYAAAAQAVLLIGISAAFGWLASRMRRMQLLAAVNLFFAANLVLFYLLFVALPGARLPLGIAFFVWVGCFNVMIIAQFWAFANDVHSKEQGKRLFGIIAGGSAIGAVLGAWFAKPFYKALGPYPIFLIGAGLLVGCLALTWIAHRMSVETAESREHEEKIDSRGGFSLVLHDRFLLFVALLSLIKNWVNTTGEYVLDRRLLEVTVQHVGSDFAARSAYIAAFKSDYFTYVNIAVLVLQLLAVSRLVRAIGVHRALFALPLIALGGYATMAFVPILSVIFIAKIVENSTDYSLQKTVEQMLFLVTDRAAKYKAKAVTDTFAVRAGDVMSAVLVWTGMRLGFQTLHFILATVALVLCWLGIVFVLARLYVAREHGAPVQEEVEKPLPPPRLRVVAST
jgi:AAA family ATP:ADP antiporter